MITHFLKVWPQYYDALESGDKNFEVRRNDRGFQKGDLLVLCQFDPKCRPNGYTGNRITRRVTYVLTGGQFGIEPGYVVLSLASVEDNVRHD